MNAEHAVVLRQIRLALRRLLGRRLLLSAPEGAGEAPEGGKLAISPNGKGRSAEARSEAKASSG